MSATPHTLLARLAGPLQSWGTRGRFTHRDTQDHPTKSGFIGMLAAALGRERDADISDLSALRFAVRADRPGVPIRDFHIVGGGQYPLRPRDLITDHSRQRCAPHADDFGAEPFFGQVAGHTRQTWYGAPKGIAPDPTSGVLVASNTRRDPIMTYRWYLADAAFVAAVESDNPSLLEELAIALDRPRRFLWLGRKACPPAGEISGGVHPGTLEAVLADTCPLPGNGNAPEPWTWIEAGADTARAAISNDQPVTFDSLHRAYTPRWEQRVFIAPGTRIGWDHLL